MNFIKFFLMTIVLVVTGTNVMAAADDYVAFGGKGVKYVDVKPRIGLTDKGGGSFDLELSSDVYKSLKKVAADQFTKPQVKNAVTVIKGIYESISKAVQTGEGLSDEQSLQKWLARHATRPVERTIRVNFSNIDNPATLASDNKAAILAFSTQAGWDAVGASNAAAELAALNRTPGAARRATAGDYANAQAAHDAYAGAAAKKSGPDAATGLVEAKAVLERARALRFGTAGRDIEYLADKETTKRFDTAAVRAAKAKVAAMKEAELLAAKSGSGITSSDRVAIDSFGRLTLAIENGYFAALQSMPEAAGLDFDDAASFEDGTAAGKLVDVLVAAAKKQRALRNDITLLGQKLEQVRAEQVAAAIAAPKKPTPSGAAAAFGFGGDSDDGMALFDIE